MPPSLPLRCALAALLLLLAACGTAPQRSESSTAKAPSARQTAAQTNMRLGQGYLEQGRLEMALEKLLKAIELDPRSTAAHTVIAVIYERIDDREQARVHYKRAVELSPKSGDVLNNYAVFLCREGGYDEADRLFERALADPFYKTPAVAHANRGSCALSAGRLDAADESLRRAVRIAPDMPDALYAMARTSMLRGDLLRARAFLQRYEATGRAGADGLALGFEVETGLGNVRAANEYRQRLLAQFPDSQAARRFEDDGAPR
jgi:type IV pilus assembly protein PilF